MLANDDNDDVIAVVVRSQRHYQHKRAPLLVRLSAQWLCVRVCREQQMDPHHGVSMCVHIHPSIAYVTIQTSSQPDTINANVKNFAHYWFIYFSQTHVAAAPSFPLFLFIFLGIFFCFAFFAPKKKKTPTYFPHLWKT